MTLRLFNTATHALEEFVPLRPGRVGIYHCGLTVQGPPHIGHIRKEVVFDVVRRWLEHHGYEVTLIANLTDIDDKVLAKSAEERRPWWAIAYANELALHSAYRALGCRAPTYEPRATGHIPEMLELVTQLIAKGHAYVAPDGSGDVYFDVRSWPAYGELSHQRVDDMEAAPDSNPRGKRDPRDFALWKGFKKGAEPDSAAWPAPWGLGRPGWHLECSAMAGKYLGDEFDIHGGGLDLRFPHHENELAQSRAAGRPFARYWMHNGMVNLGGEKMSKSVGNFLTVSEVVKRVRPIDLRYYLVAPHYRSTVDYSEEALAEAATAFQRIEGFVTRAAEVSGTPTAREPATEAAAPAGVLCADFSAAMDDDLGTPAAVGALHEVVKEGNKLLADGDSPALRGSLAAVRGMLAVLGLDPLDPVWAATTGRRVAGSASGQMVEALVRELLDQRAEARERRDFAAADRIRDRLRAAGLEVEDTPSGPRWTVVS
ncbi:MAG TPA: cysteine--tRNA ligase [Nocardioidaceae bacterium]|nr:cysteine--tRNA ligase [Nocardioidaceae bacterium]